MSYLSFIKEFELKIGITRGLDDARIDEVESHFNVSLPKAYKEFLTEFGESSGNLLSSYYMTYPSLIDNKADALKMLIYDDRSFKRKKLEIKENYFFFGQWQGYNFFFFECGINDNPPVKILNDSLEIIEYKDSFTDFLIEEGLNYL